ncbi:DUF6622 family protein [Xylophilus sp. GW821-FHT01B05]
MQLTPLIAVHMTAALGALVIGPATLWARLGRSQRPRLHRSLGYAWVVLMLVTALTAIFIRDFKLPNLAGFTPIHLLVPVVLVSLFGAFRALRQRNIARHRRIMQWLYVIGCLVAGAFTLLPNRYLGHKLWIEWLGLPLPALAQTPRWAFAVLAVLLVAALWQMLATQPTLLRSMLLPLALAALSLHAALSGFGQHALAWAGWATGAFLLVTLLRLQAREGARYDARARRFTLPGSAVPLALLLGIAGTRYALAMATTAYPGLSDLPSFAASVGTLYGALGGAAMAHALPLWRLAQRSHAERAGTGFLPQNLQP